ncbi:hypothetical protein NDA07_24815 [Microcoleus vaginatus DQ-U2]|uniref:hypothetical protein n=1 Tax=Microcoleus vaginatus TaxID=119532 RepID=UPI0032AABC3F
MIHFYPLNPPMCQLGVRNVGSKEPRKKYRRRSTFGIGQDGELWVNYLAQHSELVQELMKLTPNKRRFYQQGVRAGTLIGSIS